MSVIEIQLLKNINLSPLHKIQFAEQFATSLQPLVCNPFDYLICQKPEVTSENYRKLLEKQI